ncbi:MAG TPA: DinB family protein [Puia sp.]|nr:DinB family protein [Puia sp.]
MPLSASALSRLEFQHQTIRELIRNTKDPNFPPTLAKTLEQVLADIDEQRTTIITTLVAMDDTTLARNGIHPKYGRFSIKEWAEFFLLHEAHHMYTIFTYIYT